MGIPINPYNINIPSGGGNTMPVRIGVAELLILILVCGGPLVVGAIAFIIWWVNRSRKTDSSGPTMKKCPYCAEEIRAEAVVCRYCHRDLNQ